MDHYDFIVLGGGSAGLTAAKRVHAAGRKVALVDPTAIGGLCALRGCNPKKVLVRAVEVLQVVREAQRHGISAREVTIDWNAVIDRKHHFTDPVTEGAEESLRDAGVEYIKAAPRFVSPERLEVDGRTLHFDHALIATGSVPRKLEFTGAGHIATSDDILEMRHVPARLAIIGSGVVAFEFAHVFLRLGSEVHMLSRGEALKRSDAGIVKHAIAHLESLGLTLHRQVEVSAVERLSSTAYRVRLDNGESLIADVVLNAAGRPAQLEALALEQACVEYSAAGVKVDDCLRSVSNRKVFAAGDAHGRMQLSPIAGYEGELVADNVLEGGDKRADYTAIPTVVFTDPPLADVGCTEDEARENGLDIEVVTQDMSGWTVFRLAGHDAPVHGKAIYEKTTGRVLGAHLFGPGAAENIHVFAMAMRYGITRRQLAQMIYAYPTYCSAIAYLVD